MTTATGTAQDSTLYGPDGRPLHHPATTPAGRTPSPAPSAGEWQPVAVQGTATVWEKNAAPAPAETARALEAELAGRDARIRELEQRLTVEAAKDRTPPPAPAPATPKKPWFDRHGPKIAMYAAVGLSASGEYALACLAGFYAPVAALLPIAMDVYVIQAMRRRRDVAAALILAVAANALDRLAEARLFGVDRNGAATWWLIVSVVAIAPFIVWRIHRITETKTSSRAQRESLRETETSRDGGTETTETGETTVSVPPAETTRKTETTPDETSETSPAETETRDQSPQIETSETSETTSRETKTETTPRPRSRPVSRTRKTPETTAHTVTAIGDRETETNRLLDLMRSRGGAEKVSLDDAITETGRPKSTAAKRLSAARDLYKTA